MSTDGPADSPVKDQAGYRKLMTACENGDLEIIHGLFTKVYDPTKISVGIADHRPPHYWACRRGKLEALKVLIEKYKCNPHYVTENGHTLFHVAATRGHLEVAKYLLNKHLWTQTRPITKASRHCLQHATTVTSRWCAI